MSKKNQRLVILLSVIMSLFIFPISTLGNNISETETPNEISIVVDNTEEGINAIDAKFEEELIRTKKIKILAEYILQNSRIKDIDEASFIARKHLEASEKTGIPVTIGMAVNKRESTYRKKAISSNFSSYGMMGIHCKVWRKKKDFNISSCDQLYNIEKNIFIGYEILKEYSSYKCSEGRCYTNGLMRYHGYSSKTKHLAREYVSNVMQDANNIKRRVNNAVTSSR